MSEADVVEVEAEEVEAVELASGGAALVRRGATHELARAEERSVDDLVARLDKIKDAAERAMIDGVDFGKIPGVDKPTLLKPGAEKLCALFQLDPQFELERLFAPDGVHLDVNAKCVLYSAVTGARLGSGEGYCSTRESRYAYRKAERICPSCGAPAIIKGKAEYGGGWLCWKKKDGCGAKYADGTEAIESQSTERVDNPDIPDVYNTVVKMAQKRALVAAVLVVTGASAIFTQDVEDGASSTSSSSDTPPATAPVVEESRAASTDDLKLLHAWIGKCEGEGLEGWTKPEILGQASKLFHRQIKSTKNLKHDEAMAIVDAARQALGLRPIGELAASESPWDGYRDEEATA